MLTFVLTIALQNHVYRLDVVRHVTSLALLNEFNAFAPVELGITRDQSELLNDAIISKIAQSANMCRN